MAKALLFLRARAGGKDDLVFSTKHELERLLAAGNSDLDIRYFVSMDQDPLAFPSHLLQCSDVTIEAVAPLGRPLFPALELFRDMGKRLGSLLEFDDSIAIVGHDRVFREFTPQPICYRYLMKRRSNFCAADYHDYYALKHSYFGTVVPGVEGYLQCYIDQDASKTLAGITALSYKEFTSISELHIQSMEHFLNSGAVEDIAPVAAADEEIFVDRAASTMFCSNQVPLERLSASQRGAVEV